MNEQPIVLSKVGERFPKIFSWDRSAIEINQLVKNISEILAVGDYYFYVVDLVSEEISGQHQNMLRMHGLDRYPNDVHEVQALIHPDDVEFVIQAEAACLNKIWQIGPASMSNLKSSYSMRLRSSTGDFHFFHHQAIPLQVDHNNRLLRTLIIHSDISHITQENNYHAYITGIFECMDFYDLDVLGQAQDKSQSVQLTKRELDIVRYVAKGMSSDLIAIQLQISLHTVRVHRKNILAKLGVSNSVALVQCCSDRGYI